MPLYVIGAAIGAWVGRALLWVLASRMGAILLGLGLGVTAFTGVSFVVSKIEGAIASAYSGSVGVTVNGVAVGQLAWQMFKLAGGGDAVLMIVAAYISGASIAAGRVFLSRLAK
ncbi:DUF2523 family protein [Collimonas antrihumi]|uniref:DUF2523 family protein n=1 Tax=Collimonas antrihumi TaxID=1940615 RepID=UPI001B8D724E|nr:DUF2523 family protein [Collimonas antrihumi]